MEVTPEMFREYQNRTANAIAAKFIKRVSPPALQVQGGGYRPLRGEAFDRGKLLDHIGGRKTYGHYLIDENDLTKLFVLDFDLKKSGFLPTVSLEYDLEGYSCNHDEYAESFKFVPDLRAEWNNRHNIAGRTYLKRQMRILSNLFCGYVDHYGACGTAAAYTGNKGFHVYGFTGTVPAAMARELGNIMVGIPEYWKPTRGENFFQDSRTVFDADLLTRVPPGTNPLALCDTEFDPGHYFNWLIEVFPKQDSLEGKDLGNLVRLPLGVNEHAPKNPTFFIDLTSPLNELKPVAPLHALTTDNPFKPDVVDSRL